MTSQISWSKARSLPACARALLQALRARSARFSRRSSRLTSLSRSAGGANCEEGAAADCEDSAKEGRLAEDSAPAGFSDSGLLLDKGIPPNSVTFYLQPQGLSWCPARFPRSSGERFLEDFRVGLARFVQPGLMIHTAWAFVRMPLPDLYLRFALTLSKQSGAATFHAQTYIPTQPAQAVQEAWIPYAHEDPGRPESSFPPSREGA